MHTFALSLVTPEATFFLGDATQADIPGALGDFGVLPGHMNFISTLKPGVVTIHNTHDQQTRVFVAGGVAEVNNTSCTILAERVIDLTKLTRADADAQLAQARAAQESAFEEPALAHAKREVEVAEAIVQALAQV